jgi:hypothetical protein
MPNGNLLPGTVFTPEYLAALELEASDVPAEAEVAGPWTIHPVGDLWAVSTQGEPPELLVTSPEVALLAAAFLPGTGRDPFYRLLEERGPQGFPLVRLDGHLLGHQRHFIPELARSMHAWECLHRDPLSYARSLHSSRGPALARAGRILWLWSQVPPFSS